MVHRQPYSLAMFLLSIRRTNECNYLPVDTSKSKQEEMDEFTLHRSIEVPTSADVEDKYYGDQNMQVDMHNGEVRVELTKGDIILSALVSLTTGIEGSGNYIIFYNDRVLLIADSNQLGVEQYVELRPDPDRYTFIPTLPAELKRTSRIILRTNFTNIRAALAQNKPTKSKRKSVYIHKQRGRTELEVTIAGEDEQVQPHTIACYAISHPPIPLPISHISSTWRGDCNTLVDALSAVLASKADYVYTYIKPDGTGIYFYAYHATTGHGTRGSVGSSEEKDFTMDEKSIKLTPISLHYITYKLSKKGLKTLQKLSAEKPGELALYCLSDTTIAVSCNISDENNTHTYYFM